MITVEIKDALNTQISEVEIYCDAEGLEELQRQLNFLIRGETHIHLATPSWAGIELSEQKHNETNLLINQLTIIKTSSKD